MDLNTIQPDTPQAAPDPSAQPDRSARGAGDGGAAFWRFSLALYARPGVADALIALQDRAGLDVNLILFGLWIGAWRGHELGRDGFAAATQAAAGLNDAVRNIRALRRQLGDAADGGILGLRRLLLGLELAAERQVQRRLADCIAARTPPRAPGERSAAALANLAFYLGAESDSAEAATLRRALAALTRRA